MQNAPTHDSGKNIVVLCDGTGQEGGKNNNTNVYKLFQMIEDRTADQIAFYDPGIGTGWRKLSGNAMGVGISKNIRECYGFISDHYKWGDRIFLFGFSRGAATVRSLSGFISMFGILPHSRPDLVKQAWRIYKTSDKKRRKRKADAFLRRNTTTRCIIDFLGVWDTVVAAGTPNPEVNAVLDKIPGFQHTFHDLNISRAVHHARHALSIDENRSTFALTPWAVVTDDGQPALGDVFFDPRRGDEDEQAGRGRQQTVKQVWFTGVHTDVGGGYPETGLSDISLAWMIDEATNAKLLAHPLKLFPFNSVRVEQDIDDTIHNPRNTWLKQKLFKPGRRSWDANKGGRPVLHASVLQRERGTPDGPDVAYQPWILDEFDADFDIEPWDSRSAIYSIPIETTYRSDTDPGVT